MRRAVLVALALALALPAGLAAYVLAGGGNGPLTLPAVASGPAALKGAADAEAAAWSEEAVLVRLFATEGAPLDGRVDPPLLWDTSGDPAVADGQAIVWTFGYADPQKAGKTFWVAVGGDGVVVYARELAEPWDCCVAIMDGHAMRADAVCCAPTPLAFTVDAPEAWAAVAADPEVQRFAADHPVFQARHELVPQGDGGAVWSMTLQTATWFSLGANVDAATGEVVSRWSWPHTDPPCCPEPPPPPPAPQDQVVTFDGRLTSSHPVWDATLPYLVRAHAKELAVDVELDATLPAGGSYSLSVLDPMGRPVARVEGSDPLALVVDEFSADGPWSLRVEPVGNFYGSLVDEVRLTAAVRIDYVDEVLAEGFPATLHGEGRTWAGMSPDWWFPLHTGGFIDAVEVTVLADGLPTDGIEVVLLDAMGNEVAWSASERGAGTVTLAAPLGAWDGAVVVRHQGFSATGVRFALDVALDYGEPAEAWAVAYATPPMH